MVQYHQKVLIRRRPVVPKALLDALKKRNFQRLNQTDICSSLDAVTSEILALLGSLKLCKLKIKSEFWRYLKVMHSILGVFYKNFEQDAKRRVQEHQRSRGLRLFTMPHVTKLRAGGISLQTIHLYVVLKKVQINQNVSWQGFPTNKLLFMDRRDSWWRMWLNFSKFERPTAANYSHTPLTPTLLLFRSILRRIFSQSHSTTTGLVLLMNRLTLLFKLQTSL